MLMRHPANRAAVGGDVLRTDHHPDVPADGRVRAGQRHRRRSVQGDRRLGRPDSRRPRHGDRACRRRLRRDLRHQHGLGRDAVGDQPARDDEAGLRAQDGGRRGRDLGHAGDADPAIGRARHLRPAGRSEYRRAADRRRHPRHPRDHHHHGDVWFLAWQDPSRAPSAPPVSLARKIPAAAGGRADAAAVRHGDRRDLYRRRDADRSVGAAARSAPSCSRCWKGKINAAVAAQRAAARRARHLHDRR